MSVFIWLITAFGISQILVYGGIFEPFRDWLERRSKWLHELFSCMMCCGAWVGFALSFAWSPTSQSLLRLDYLNWFLDGMFASGGIWIINTLVSHFDSES